MSAGSRPRSGQVQRRSTPAEIAGQPARCDVAECGKDDTHARTPLRFHRGAWTSFYSPSSSARDKERSSTDLGCRSGKTTLTQAKSSTPDGCEQRQLHAIRCLHACVAVAPRGKHRGCDFLNPSRHKSPRGLLAVRDLEREPHDAGNPMPSFDRVDFRCPRFIDYPAAMERSPPLEICIRRK